MMPRVFHSLYIYVFFGCGGHCKVTWKKFDLKFFKTLGLGIIGLTYLSSRVNIMR